MEYLFPKTGIQYIEIENCFDNDADGLDDLKSFLIDATSGIPRVCMQKDAADSGMDQGFGDIFGSGDGGDESLGFDTPVEDVATFGTETIEATARQGLDLFANGWLPVPYASANPFWTRMFIRRNVDLTYSLILAVDTSFARDAQNAWLLRSDEIGSTLHPEPGHARFWESDYIARFVRNLMARIPAENGASERQQYIDLVSRFWALTAFCAKHLPKLNFLSPHESSFAPVGVDLVIDFGNCRTCAVVMERTGDPGDARFYRVKMRSRTRPYLVDEGTIDSRFVFSRSPKAVHQAVFPESGSFRELSIARVGHDASEREVGSERSNLSASSMSSPKRYLWDEEPQRFNWCFDDEVVNGTTVSVEGDILRYMEPDKPFGWGAAAQGSAGMPNPGTTNYCRKSGMIFLFSEILTQAYSFINSLNHRKNAPMENSWSRRRVLDNVLLTFPTGMPEIEKAELKRGVEKAVRLWHRYLEDVDRFCVDGQFVSGPLRARGMLQPEPAVSLECDEATAIQLAYLYMELLGPWQNESAAFFDLYGRDRDGSKVLRLASIDVGGGTTDLAITDYTRDREAIGYTRIISRPVFSCGMKCGGDDVLKYVIEQSLLPELIKDSGVENSRWKQLFQTDMMADSEWSGWRKELVSQLWTPVMRQVWGTLEQGTAVNNEPISRLSNIAVSNEEPYRILSERLGRDWKLTDAPVNMRASDLKDALRSVVGKSLEDCANIIALYDCDLLVLGGRVMGHPWFVEKLQELCPVPPSSVVPLHGFSVQPGLYPFSDADGKVQDAKTCVAVGATIHYRARTLGGSLRLEVEQNPNAVSRITGILNPATSRMAGESLFADDRTPESSAFRFGGELWLGEKNIADADAVASPTWKINWAPAVERYLREGWMVDGDPLVQLQRQNVGDLQVLRIGRCEGKFKRINGSGSNALKKEHLRIRFQTMFNDRYWLDTGVLDMAHL